MRRVAYHYPQGENLWTDLALSDVDTAAVTPVAGTCYAEYLGRAPKDLTSFVGWLYQGVTAASGITWAEFGIASGNLPTALNGQTTLTPLAFTDISANVSGGSGPYLSALSVVVPAGTPLWSLVSVSCTVTQPQMRGRLAGDFWGKRVSKAATRISTNLNTAVAAFQSATAGINSFAVNVRWS